MFGGCHIVLVGGGDDGGYGALSFSIPPSSPARARRVFRKMEIPVATAKTC